MLRYYFPLLLLIALVAWTGNVQAAGEDARKFVDDVGQKVLSIVNGTAAEAEKQQQLRQTFSENVDMEWMGKFVLGRAWAQATEDQRSRYLQAYREYLLARYTTNFADYTNSHYAITGAKSEADGQYIVGMQVKSPNAEEQETQAGYRVHSAGGQFKIIDIIVEGVSLITTQRSEFTAVVSKSGMDGLIKELEAKKSQIEQRK